MADAEVLSNRDDIANDVRAAYESLKTAAEPVDPAVTVDDHPEAVETVEQPAPVEAKTPEKPRGPDGKFAPAPKVAKESPVEAKAPEEIPSTDIEAKASVAAQPAIAPPAGWTAAEKAEWSKLPPAIQTAVSRRETEIANGGKQWSEEKRYYQTTLAPIAQLAQSKGIPLDQGLQSLARAQQFLDTDAPNALRWLAQSYGVDLQTLASTPAPQTPRIDPTVAHLGSTVTQLQTQLQGFLQTQVQSAVESFASSKDHPYFDEVSGELERIIPMVQQQNPGLPHYEVLSKAYEQAIWQNPSVRDKLIAERTQPAQQANVVAAKAVQAKRAAVSIKGASNGSMAPKAVESTGDVYDDVRAALRQLRQ